MDLKQLRHFVAVAEEGNLSRAAARLHITQPPLTRHIQALEEELGAALFVRTSKGVALTAAGSALLETAPTVLQLAARAADQSRRAAQGLVGRLDVGVFGSGVLNTIPAMLARFHRVRPDVQIRLHNMNKAEQIQALRERRITLGFNRLVPPEPDLRVETVLRERLWVGLPADHALCKKRSLTLGDLAGAPMILYPNLPMRGLAQKVVDAFDAEGVNLRVEQEVEDVLTCISLVANGFGMCITTESASGLQLPGICYRPLKSKHLVDLELACLYRKDDRSPILHAFMELVRGSAAARRAPVPVKSRRRQAEH